MTGKHKPRDKKVKGKPMRQCRHCGVRWQASQEAVMMTTKCGGRDGLK